MPQSFHGVNIKLVKCGGNPGRRMIRKQSTWYENDGWLYD
jgi:hypothetical protein